MQKPKIIDNGVDAIIVSVDGMELYRLSYSYPAEQINQVAMARAYICGWAAAMTTHPNTDLLAALIRLIADIAEAYDADETLTPNGEEVMRARAAIAKAEGQKP